VEQKQEKRARLEKPVRLEKQAKPEKRAKPGKLKKAGLGKPQLNVKAKKIVFIFAEVVSFLI